MASIAVLTAGTAALSNDDVTGVSAVAVPSTTQLQDPFALLRDPSNDLTPRVLFSKPFELSITDEEELKALEYQAQEGNPAAMWRLGNHYARSTRSENEPQNHLKAFKMFHSIIMGAEGVSPHSERAPYVANALNWLGRYYQRGIPGSDIVSNRAAAWQMFYTAGNVFRDPQALFSLSEMCTGEDGFHCSPKQGLRWLNLAAEKGHVRAQARLGYRLYEGEMAKRHPVKGLTWLTIALDISTPAEREWISKAHEQAFSTATVEERQAARNHADRWIQKRCSKVGAC